MRRADFDGLLAEWEPRLKSEFFASIAEIRDNVVLRIVVERLERGDIEGAIAALQIDVDAFARLERAILDAYNAGGTAEVAGFPRLRDPNGNRIVFRWGTRNLYAENELRQHSAALVTRIVADQRNAIRAALADGLAAGQNPRQTGLDIIGRVNRATGRREGGIIGLTAAQERAVTAARAELLSGDPRRMAAYFDRERRDKRFDATIRRAIKTGRLLDQATVDRIVGRYSDRLLDLRGEMLARTETMTALGKGRDAAIREQIAAGKLDGDDVKKVWRSARDARVRFTHRRLNGQDVGLDEHFVSPSGAMLMFPGDPNAPIAEISGCRCWMEYRIDYGARVERRFRAEAA